MKRILTAAVLIPIIVWTVLFAPAWAFLLVCALVGTAAYREFDGIVGAHGIERTGWVGIAIGLAVLAVPDRMLIAVLVLGAMLLAILAMQVVNLSHALMSAASGYFGVVYIFGAWRCAVNLRGMGLFGEPIGPHWLMIALLVCWAGDTAALYVGHAIGKRKMAPRVSPGKTWEGAAGSVAGGMIVGVVYMHFLLPAVPVWAALLVSGAANIAGQFGDLVESAMKRGAGLKDSGTMLPGHGGWLDRIDSSLFAIPAVYGIFRLILDLS